jgi:hypothetical protein
VNHSEAASRSIGVLPICHTGYSCAHCARQTYSDRRIRGHAKLTLVAHQIEAIEYKRNSPGPNRDVGKDYMERFADPRAVQEILNCLSSFTSTGERFVD